MQGDGLAFEARGKRCPQSVEVNPLPKTGWANGGRCCPHSENPFILDPSLAGANKSLYFLTSENLLTSNYFFRHIPTSGNAARNWQPIQLTKRRSRTFITRPIARKTNSVAEPP